VNVVSVNQTTPANWSARLSPCLRVCVLCHYDHADTPRHSIRPGVELHMGMAALVSRQLAKSGELMEVTGPTPNCYLFQATGGVS
jgi:hypothetical protein